MSAFTMIVRDSQHEVRFDDIESFVGRDASGSFGIEAHAETLLAVLVFGLARFRTTDGEWHYLALPGALCHFADNRLTLTATQFLHSRDVERMTAALEQELRISETNIRSTKVAIRRMEQTLMRKIWEMSTGARRG